MISVLVMANDLLLASAIASRLAGEISPETIRVAQHELDRQDHQSLVMVIEQGERASGSVFFSFYSLHTKTQEREKRDAALSARLFTGFDL
jgi:hypothetical protein